MLSELDYDQIQKLRDELTIDQESFAILDTYISRHFEEDGESHDTNESSSSRSHTSSSSMSRLKLMKFLALRPTHQLGKSRQRIKNL